MSKSSKKEDCDILLHGHPPHLLLTPILSHILGAQRLDLLVQVLPQDVAPGLHALLEGGELKGVLAGLASAQVGAKDVEPGVDVAVLGLQVAAELGHALPEDGEDVALLNVVVHGQLVDEAEALVEELLEGHAARAAVLRAGGPEERPCLTKMVMLEEGWVGY